MCVFSFGHGVHLKWHIKRLCFTSIRLWKYTHSPQVSVEGLRCWFTHTLPPYSTRQMGGIYFRIRTMFSCSKKRENTAFPASKVDTCPGIHVSWCTQVSSLTWPPKTFLWSHVILCSHFWPTYETEIKALHLGSITMLDCCTSASSINFHSQ